MKCFFRGWFSFLQHFFLLARLFMKHNHVPSSAIFAFNNMYFRNCKHVVFLWFSPSIASQSQPPCPTPTPPSSLPHLFGCLSGTKGPPWHPPFKSDTAMTDAPRAMSIIITLAYYWQSLVLAIFANRASHMDSILIIAWAARLNTHPPNSQYQLSTKILSL